MTTQTSLNEPHREVTDETLMKHFLLVSVHDLGNLWTPMNVVYSDLMDNFQSFTESVLLTCIFTGKHEWPVKQWMTSKKALSCPLSLYSYARYSTSTLMTPRYWKWVQVLLIQYFFYLNGFQDASHGTYIELNGTQIEKVSTHIDKYWQRLFAVKCEVSNTCDKTVSSTQFIQYIKNHYNI